MIKLTFRSLDGELSTLLRGTYFRICEDETLRGPDNSVAARYSDGLWHLGHRRHRAFECAGPVYLRTTAIDGRRENVGPFDFLKAANGAIFSRDTCLGIHSPRRGAVREEGMWREIVFLLAIGMDSVGIRATSDSHDVEEGPTHPSDTEVITRPWLPPTSPYPCAP